MSNNNNNDDDDGNTTDLNIVEMRPESNKRRLSKILKKLRENVFQHLLLLEIIIMTMTRTLLTPKYDTMVLIEIHLENSSFYLENGKGLLPSLLVVVGVREGGKVIQ